MNVLDLFAGIGGFSLGLEKAGFRTVAFCEIDPYCRRVLAAHWPGVPVYADIRSLTAARLAADGIAVDVIAGGFPCQDISVAGHGAGIDGERSGLWRHFARLIGELRPQYAIVENVPALLSRGLGRVLGDLAALGFDAEWHCIPAAAVGAPHRRDRIWIVGYPDSERAELQQPERRNASEAERSLFGRCSAPVALADGSRREREQRQASAWETDPTRRRSAHVADADIDPGEQCGAGDANERAGGRNTGGSGISAAVAHTNGQRAELQQPASGKLDTRERRLSGGCGAAVAQPDNNGLQVALRAELRRLQSGQCESPSGSGFWSVESDVGRVAHGVPARVDRLRALGNALVPQIAEMIGRAILEERI